VASNFPTSLDNFTNPSSGNTLDSPSHSLQHSDINDAVEAMQRKVGVGTAVAGSASAGQVLTISAAGTSTWSGQGLTQIIPTSVAVGSGSGSADANGRVTFSGCSSVSFNGVFSSTYDTYKIILSGNTGSSAPYDLRLRFRDGTGDISSANYQSKQIFGRESSTTASENGGNNSSQTSSTLVFGGAITNDEITVFRPNLATITSYVFMGDYAVGGYLFGSGTFNLTTQFTGFSLIPSAGNITGTISIFGYR
jgi:hypothetical protein